MKNKLVRHSGTPDLETKREQDMFGAVALAKVETSFDTLLDNHDDKVVDIVDDEMDDLLDDHDDKVVDIVGDNMNDLLDAHDDKVVSIVGDNMSTLLSSNAAAIQLIAGDHSGIGTTAAVKVGTWDATHDIYAKRYTGTIAAIAETSTISLDTLASSTKIIGSEGAITYSDGKSYPVSDGAYLNSANQWYIQLWATNQIRLIVGSALSEGSYELIVYYLVPITPPTP